MYTVILLSRNLKCGESLQTYGLLKRPKDVINDKSHLGCMVVDGAQPTSKNNLSTRQEILLGKVR